jgi:hypothetical protein
MTSPISSGLKTTFLVHAIVGMLFGLGYLLIPATVGGWFGVAMTDPGWRLVGAALIGFAMSSWWAYRATDWSQVEIVVQMEIVWTVLGAAATIWALMSGALPVMGWLNVVVLLAFAVAFGYFYSRKS